MTGVEETRLTMQTRPGVSGQCQGSVRGVLRNVDSVLPGQPDVAESPALVQARDGRAGGPLRQCILETAERRLLRIR